MAKFVSQDEYIKYHEAVLKDLRQQILKGFSSLSYTQMDALEQAVHYRKRTIAFAKTGKMTCYVIE